MMLVLSRYVDNPRDTLGLPITGHHPSSPHLTISVTHIWSDYPRELRSRLTINSSTALPRQMISGKVLWFPLAKRVTTPASYWRIVAGRSSLIQVHWIIYELWLPCVFVCCPPHYEKLLVHRRLKFVPNLSKSIVNFTPTVFGVYIHVPTRLGLILLCWALLHKQ